MFTNKVQTAPTFEGYEGGKMYIVSAPKHHDLTVYAPDENAAIVTAAKHWKERWQAWEFYSSCAVRKAK